MLNDQPSKSIYDGIFKAESAIRYPLIDMFESNWGYAVDSERLLNAARVLACPMKLNPPNWQHGRIIYTVLRTLLRRFMNERVQCFDIGTAKGFSALMMSYAAHDAKHENVNIISCDVIDPDARIRRNTVADCDGVKTLGEILAPFSPDPPITFRQLGASMCLAQHVGRIHFAFIDGKHRYESVKVEGGILRQKQESGDISIFDDVQIPGVQQAIEELKDYDKDYISASSFRKYCIATRK